MNDADYDVINAVIDYFGKHGKYPQRVEVTEDLRWELTQTKFSFEDMTSIFSKEPMLDHAPMKSIEIPVTAVGDDVSRSFFIRQVAPDLEEAQRCTEMCYGKLQHDLATKNININTHIVDKTTKKHLFQEGQYMCDVYGVAYGYETILKDLKEIIKG